MERVRMTELGWLFEEHVDALVLYARQWLALEDARDIVCEAFFKLTAQATPRKVKSWLYRCVRNAALNRLRSVRIMQKHAQALAARNDEWFESQNKDAIDTEEVRWAVESLSEDRREIVVMRIWGQMTLAEISAVLDEPVSTIFSRYEAALKEMKLKLEPLCGKIGN